MPSYGHISVIAHGWMLGDIDLIVWMGLSHHNDLIQSSNILRTQIIILFKRSLIPAPHLRALGEIVYSILSCHTVCDSSILNVSRR